MQHSSLSLIMLFALVVLSHQNTNTKHFVLFLTAYEICDFQKFVIVNVVANFMSNLYINKDTHCFIHLQA